METKQWPANYQQSVVTALERTDDMLDNGNGNTENIVKKTEAPTDGNTSHENNPSNIVEQENNPPNITISEKAKQTIHIILEQIKSLSQVEQFLLYLKLPAEVSNVVDPFRQPLNPLGSRSEIYRTISWIRTHLEEDPDTSLPKQEVYDEYFQYCSEISIKPLSQADFGKVMKQVYPKVRARRLGTRGKSRYCYSGLTRCIKLKAPSLPDLAEKPLSTEAPCTQSSLSSAAWLIVRDWSHQQLGIQFSSLKALAYYLILNHSIGVGTEAANKLTSVAESQMKEENGSKNGNKHREMQLQLQRKIQQKNEVNKERKRKVQLPKCEQKPTSNNKKAKLTNQLVIKTETSPTLAASCATSECSSTNSSSTSPTQGKPNCDKSLDFTHLTTLPDFNSFQKPTTADGVGSGSSGETNKIAIPRLPTQTQINQQPVPISPAKKQAKNAKYKAIQPRLQQCDIASYNLQSQTADNRSQDVHNLDRIKERKLNDDCDVATDFPLSRERLNSISNVEKDAMDEYLGTNNSQHDEELSKYFTNNNVKDTGDPKISNLRQLLQQNLVENPQNAPGCFRSNPVQTPQIQTTSYITPLHHRLTNPSGSNARRRVSFETPVAEDAVPPSPNTRRKNFSFTPISDGPQSPGIQSKCSSTNASPFVSPRNTPVPRTKNTMHHQNAGIMLKPLKKEIELQLDAVPQSYMPMSAPASPMLQKLLNANSKVAYKPGYSGLVADTSQEIRQFFANDIQPALDGVAYRSQSVPLHQMASSLKTFPMTYNEEFHTDLPESSGPANDFNEIDPIPESDSDNVKRILNALNEQQCDNNNIDVFNVELSTTSNQCLSEFGLQLVNNNMEMPSDGALPVIYNNMGMVRNLGRSQSIDVQYIAKSNHFRSVPSTPLPFTNDGKQQDNSRSYPTTPLTNDPDNFSYNMNGDCLLNGQPIRTDDPLTFIAGFDEGAIEQEKGFHMDGHEFAIVENGGNSIMDENCVLIEQNYSGNMN